MESTSQPMPSAKEHAGKYHVLGTSQECVVERLQSGAWMLLVNGDFHKLFFTKREALVYCQDHAEL